MCLLENRKKLLAVHDLSGFGKCSLTIALPIISSAGIEVSVLPISLFSTHTGFSGFVCRDLSEEMISISRHWSNLGVAFDYIYTGYMNSVDQIYRLIDVLKLFRSKDTIVLVDPVMADNGALYKLLPDDFPLYMRKLILNADIITPNITEACMLLDLPVYDGPYSEKSIIDILKRLSKFGPQKIIITGIAGIGNDLCVACYDATSSIYRFYHTEKLDGRFHGTGDLFSSVLISALCKKWNLFDAVQLSMSITRNCILRTKKSNFDSRYGLYFEPEIKNISTILGSS